MQTFFLTQAPAVVIVCLLTNAAWAAIDETFQWKQTFTNGILTFIQHAVQPDGKIILSGAIDGEFHLLRLNPDGSRDSSFKGDSTFKHAQIGRIVSQPGKGILISAVQGLFRVTESGMVDKRFIVTTNDENWSISALAILPDNKIILANTSTNKTVLRRLHADGEPDASFPELTTMTQQGPFHLITQSEGKIVMAGSFTEVAGAPRSGIARLNQDGSLDLRFAPRLTFRPEEVSMFYLFVQEDQSIQLTGNFSAVDSIPHIGIARLKPDGSLDETFQPTGPAWIVSEVNSRLFAFDSFALIELRPDGTRNRNFDPVFITWCSDGPGSPFAWRISPHGGGLIMTHPLLCSGFTDRTGLVRIRFDDPPAASGLRMIVGHKKPQFLDGPGSIAVAAVNLESNMTYQLEASNDLKNWSIENENVRGSEFMPPYFVATDGQSLFFRLRTREKP